LNLAQVKNRLMQAERMNEHRRQGMGGGRGNGAQMNHVSGGDSNHRRSIRQETGSSARGRRQDVNEAMMRSACRRWDGFGHWVRNCPSPPNDDGDGTGRNGGLAADLAAEAVIVVADAVDAVVDAEAVVADVVIASLTTATTVKEMGNEKSCSRSRTPHLEWMTQPPM
jgi:hypothetical protein